MESFKERLNAAKVEASLKYKEPKRRARRAPLKPGRKPGNPVFIQEKKQLVKKENEVKKQVKEIFNARAEKKAIENQRQERERRPLKLPDLKGKVAVQVDSKTWIYAAADADPQAVINKWNNRPRPK